jgi:hypothetical protein
MGTPRSAKTLVLITNPAGSRAAPEKRSPRAQRASNAPGAINRTKVPATGIPGRVEKTSRQGPTAAKAAPPIRARLASNQRKEILFLPNFPFPRLWGGAFFVCMARTL